MNIVSFEAAGIVKLSIVYINSFSFNFASPRGKSAHTETFIRHQPVA